MRWLRWVFLRKTRFRWGWRYPLSVQLYCLYRSILDKKTARRRRLSIPLELAWRDEDVNTQYKHWLSQVLHEATFLAFEIDVQKRLATMTFEVLVLSEDASRPTDRHIKLVFAPVGRIALSRYAISFEEAGDDFVEMVPGATMPCTIDRLEETVRSRAGQPLYLDSFWEESFFDVDEAVLVSWGNQCSLDWQVGPDGRTHSFFVFQEWHEEHLALVLWFDTLDIRRLDDGRLDLIQLVRDNDQWWQAFYANDPRTQGFGLYPA